MVNRTRALMIAAILGTLGLAGRGSAQDTLPPTPSPVPVLPPLTAPGPTISRPAPDFAQPQPVPPPGGFQPISPPPAPPPTPGFTPPPPGPAPAIGTPYGSGDRQPQMFFDWELQFVAPTVSNHLNNTVTLPDGTTKIIAIPGVGLNFTVAPKLEMGWRLADGTGDFIVGYRFLTTDGTSSSGSTSLRSRLDFNELSFDYATPRYEFEPHWWLQARIGARVTWNFYDTSAVAGPLSDSENNYFVGAGPHFTFDVERQLPMGIGIFGRLDGAVLIGQADQRFEEGLVGSYVTATLPPKETTAVPTLQVQLGVSYTPPRFERLRFEAGYQYEHWFDVGDVDGSRLDFSSQGGFLRGTIAF